MAWRTQGDKIQTQEITTTAAKSEIKVITFIRRFLYKVGTISTKKIYLHYIHIEVMR